MKLTKEVSADMAQFRLEVEDALKRAIRHCSRNGLKSELAINWADLRVSMVHVEFHEDGAIVDNLPQMVATIEEGQSWEFDEIVMNKLKTTLGDRYGIYVRSEW